MRVEETNDFTECFPSPAPSWSRFSNTNLQGRGSTWLAPCFSGSHTPHMAASPQGNPIIAVWSLQTVCGTSFAGPPDVVVAVAIRPPPRTVRRHTRWRTESYTSVRPRPPESLLFGGKEHAAIDPSGPITLITEEAHQSCTRDLCH